MKQEKAAFTHRVKFADVKIGTLLVDSMEDWGLKITNDDILFYIVSSRSFQILYGHPRDLNVYVSRLVNNHDVTVKEALETMTQED